MSTETQTSMTLSAREPRTQRSSDSNSRHTTASKSGGRSEKTIHFRTKPCTFFFTARGCVKGSKCNFRHDKLEVEPVQTSSAYSGSDCEPAPREQRRRRPAQNVAVGPRLTAESVSRLSQAGSTNKTHPIRYRTIGGGVMVGRASTGSSPPSPATPLDPQTTLPNSLVPANDCQLPPDYEDVSDSTTVYESPGNVIPLPPYIPLYIPHATAPSGVHSTPPSSIGAPLYHQYPYLPTSPLQPHAMLAPPMLPLPYPHPPLPGTLWVSESPEKPMLDASPVFINGQAELPDVVCGLYADPGGLVIPLRSPVALPMYASTGATIPRPSSAPPPLDSFTHSTWLGDEHSRRVSLQGGL